MSIENVDSKLTGESISSKYFLENLEIIFTDFFGGFFVCFCFFHFLGPYPWHMEVPRLGVELELELLVYTTATAMQDPSCVCDLHHSDSNAGSEPHLRPTPQLTAMPDT